jgi:hypothetical protein
MNTGITKSQIEAQLRDLMRGLKNVDALYGFGSFFRSAEYNDIDLVVVISCSRHEQVRIYEEIIDACGPLSKRIGLRFDITPLTPSEFAEEPLREMKSLVPIYIKGASHASVV